MTSHLLTAPAFWHRPDGLQTPLRLVSVFHEAVIALIAYQNTAGSSSSRSSPPGRSPIGGGPPFDLWIRAVILGANERSQRWKHLIVLSGLLTGIASQEEQGQHLKRVKDARKTVEGALVKATNLAVEELTEWNEVNGLGAQTIALSLNYAFGHLSDEARRSLNYDLLLPMLVGPLYFSNGGLESAYFLGGIDLNVEVKQDKLLWPVS